MRESPSENSEKVWDVSQSIKRGTFSIIENNLDRTGELHVSLDIARDGQSSVAA
jgi:hypothetical protein